MRIAEISTPELWQTNRETEPLDNQHPIISDLEIYISQTEALTRDHKPVSETIPSALKQSLTRLARLSPLPNNTLKLQIWKLSFRLWNACVDLSNAASLRSPSSSSSLSSAENVARLRHVASDMLSLAGDVSGIPSSAIKCALFYHRTGLVWHDLKKLDLASACFERATEIVSKLDVSKISDAGERKFLLDLNLARARTAWETSDRNLAATLVNRAKIFLFGSPENYKTLANQFLAFAKSALSTEEANSLNDALRLMNEALDLTEKGLGVAKTREDTEEFKLLRCKTLRFISAVHLQKGEYKSVIKCVKVLRGAGDGREDHHASLPVLAMKAWLGMEKYSEAEEELRSMVGNKEIPEGVWVSAVEAYFEAVGTAGAETAKGVFLGLIGRCHVSPKAALRVAHRVLGDSSSGDQGSKIRAKVVAQLASDERVVALFAGEAAIKERKAMHSILWNCGSDHFRAKDYETSAEMYEKSLLYVPHDIENRVFRAKGFRVLCLCHLGLTQLDRAHEYIDEAEKLEPNIACAFLKFKIFLQKNDHTSAATQTEAMTSCLDFTPDFLVLSAHEAVACEALSVAVATLSKLLNFFTSGKAMPTSEVVVLRTLITVLAQDNGRESEALNFMQQAHSQASKLGIESFFGVGEVGRREQKWFAVTSWNFGTKCGKEKNYELCAEFLLLSSEFYGFTSDGQVGENSVLVCKSLILSVTAMIASENENHTLGETEVKQAAALLDKAGKILTSVSKRCGPPEDDGNSFEDELFFMYTVNSYDLHGRLNNSETQQLLVKSFFDSKACNPNYLLQIAILASQTPNTNPEVAIFALNQCLSSLLSSSTPEYSTVALVIRKLIAISSILKGDADDDVVSNMYKQAYRIMVGLKDGEYPVEEGKWLAMTAWNRAALPVRLGQTETARKWMNVGLEIARKIPGMDTYTACMEDFVAGFGKKSGMHKDAVECST